jgi:arabinogalactan endo-1,4-beta-galactosidase
MRILILLILFGLLISCDQRDCCGPPQPPDEKILIRGVDVSFLPEIEAAGTKFYDASGVEADVLDILKSNGVNTIRLRLWHTPSSVHSSLEEVTAFSERIKSKGFKLWLTVHYSDWWADPGQQVKPAAWEDASFADLADSVYNYTKKITTILNPDIIQLGNEVNPGFLLPDGGTSTFSNFTNLLKRGVQAVRETSSDTEIMIHIAGFNTAEWFYQELEDQDVDYDMIGLSYYPIFHGKDLNALQLAMNTLGAVHDKKVLIAETSYPFTLEWEDNTHNTVGLESHLISGYPATQSGQKNFTLKIRDMVTKSPNGYGFAWWAPEWVAFKEPGAADGSSAENLTLFDFDNKALPALDAFHESLEE